MFKSRVTDLFSIQYPIIQGGMVWCSGWKLASAVSNAGGLGIIGAGSMQAGLLEEHIIKCKQATNFPFAVNLPLLYENIEQQIEVLIKQNVKIVFTSAGNPAKYCKLLKDAGIIVVHVVASLKFALKAQDAGCDAIVVEGFEAGGHNGRDETTTLCLLQLLKNQISIPIIAAGGIGTGDAILACKILGAEGVQLGSVFAASEESSAHENFKQLIYESKEGDTDLVLKKLNPVRLLKNSFYNEIKQLEMDGATAETLKSKLGKGRAKKGIYEGDLVEGEIEIGQIVAIINQSKSVSEIMKQLVDEYNEAYKKHFC